MVRANYVLVTLLATVGTGCARDAQSPTDTFRLIQAAAKTHDLDSFRKCVSYTTIDFLRTQDARDEIAIDESLSFMLERIAGGSPYEIVGQEVNGNIAYLDLSGRDLHYPDKPMSMKLKFVNEDGEWKIDLKDAYQAWIDLADWARKVQKDMERATPMLDDLSHRKAP